MKYINIIVLTFALVLFTGCVQPRYDYEIPSNNVKIKRIIQGTHEGNRFYLQSWDTIKRPVGDTWLSASDIGLYYKEPSKSDWEGILKLALLLHENEHAINQYAYLPYIFALNNYRWVNEREGYHKQFATWIKYGLPVTKDTEKDMVRVIMNPWYRSMCTEDEAIAFVTQSMKDARERFPQVEGEATKWSELRKSGAPTLSELLREQYPFLKE